MDDLTNILDDGRSAYDLDDELEGELSAVTAERDRLREELESQGRDLVAARVNAGINSETVGRLAAESAGLRRALDSFREHVLCHAKQWTVEGGTHHHPAWRAVADALASPSPLAAAVQRVLEAAGRMREAHDDWDHTFDPEEAQRHWDRYEGARIDAFAAHDHLQALLEGKGEGE